MSTISYIVLISAILNLTLIKLFGNKFNLVIFIISSWWFLWLFISTLSLTGLNTPTNDTYYLFITMLSSTTLGGLGYILILSAGRRKSLGRKTVIVPEKYFSIKIIYLLNYLLSLPITFFFFQKAIKIFISNPILMSMGYRTAVFGENILFENDVIRLFYNIIISPIQLTSLFIGTAIFILNNKKHLLLLSSFIFIMDAIMMMGRFQFYTIIICLLTGFIYKKRSNIYAILKDINFYKFVVPALILISYVTIARSGSNFQLEELIKRYVIEYHTLSFSLFDDELSNPMSLINQDRTYGRASLGILERICVLFIRRFDKSIDSVPEQVGTYLNDFRILGYDHSGKPLIFNAYGTILYPIYMDGGLILILLLSIIYGFYLVRITSLSIVKPNVYNISILFTLSYLGIFGIFTPLITGNYWLVLLYIKLILRNKLIPKK